MTPLHVIRQTQSNHEKKPQKTQVEGHFTKHLILNICQGHQKPKVKEV